MAAAAGRSIARMSARASADQITILFTQAQTLAESLRVKFPRRALWKREPPRSMQLPRASTPHRPSEQLQGPAKADQQLTPPVSFWLPESVLLARERRAPTTVDVALSVPQLNSIATEKHKDRVSR